MKRQIVALLVVLLSSELLADERYFSGQLLLGDTTQETDEIDHSDTMFGARGSYHVSPNLAFELSVHDYGESNRVFDTDFGTVRRHRLNSSSLNLGVKTVYPLDNGLSVHARAGLMFWDVSLDIAEQNSGGSSISYAQRDMTGNDMYVGFGGEYLINDKYTVGLEYTVSEFGLDEDVPLIEDVALDVSTFSFAVGMRF